MAVISIFIFLSSILAFSEYLFCSCQQFCRPQVTDLSRMYNFVNWSVSHCNRGLNVQVQYFQIVFADISEGVVRTSVTNLTSTSSSCDVTSSSVCYFRVRAELDVSSVSSYYSYCLNITDQLTEKKVSIMQFQDVCIQVNGVCLDGVTPTQYRINGEIPSMNDYNFTYIRGSGFVLCMKNISRIVVVTEWCEFLALNNFCLPSVGVLMFLSRTEVHVEHPSLPSNKSISIQSSVTIRDLVVTSTINTYLTMYNMKELQPYEIEVMSTAANFNNKNTIITIIAVPLGISSALFIIVISMLLITISYKRNLKSTEPTNPEPVYETIPSCHEEKGVEMKKNEAYMSFTKINMTDCQAYST